MHFLRRLLYMLLVIVGVSVLMFVLVRVIPGDPIAKALGPGADAASIKKMRDQMGLDQPTPARLDKVCADFRSGKIERARLDRPQAMVFIDRDGTINREVDHLRDPAQLELLSGAAEAIRRLNASEYRCCVVSNQPVIARGECTFEDMRAIHNRLETMLGREGAYVDRIYYCPHHPERGFPGERVELKTACNCRKPNTGMIDRAARDFNIAREQSWLIGDTSVDIETARRSGLKSILVETGYAGLDYRWWTMPDATVPDLAAAVSFVLDG